MRVLTPLMWDGVPMNVSPIGLSAPVHGMTGGWRDPKPSRISSAYDIRDRAKVAIPESLNSSRCSRNVQLALG